MALLSLQNVSIGFGGPPLLEKVTLQAEKGERVCLLGRNGEGKTTLLRIISGEIRADSGVVAFQKGTTITGLSQELPSGLKGTVYDVVAGGLGKIGVLLEKYRHLTKELENGAGESILKRLDTLQERLEAEQGWQVRQHVETVLSRLSLEPDIAFGTLSVGFRRRVLLARALVAEPNILLLDEPTNHLDIAAIEWMETFLQKYRGALIFVTHDRMFLQKLATRIVEIDRGRLVSWECGYEEFLQRRQGALDAEEAQRERFKKKLAKEEEWIRKGIKARRTRNEGRVRALQKMREQQQGWRQQTGNVNLRIQNAQATGKLVVEACGIFHRFGGDPIINDFSLRIIRGDRIGIIGPNGIGKTTLLRILLGEIEPDEGRLRTGMRLETVYFDQLREQLDEGLTVWENVADGNDTFPIDGKVRHVMGHLKDFLFPPDRARSPVGSLSGGERNRLMLARLFTRPFNLLVLDEPTNDLDMETLELLEERLLDYSGTLLLVSHDRTFLNNVVTSTLVFEKDGNIQEYAGGYDDWLSQRPDRSDERERDKGRSGGKGAQRKEKEKKDRPRKLTYKEARELEALPGRIEGLDDELKELYKQTSDPEFYRRMGDEKSRLLARIDEIDVELVQAYERWEELEGVREATHPS